MKKIFAIILFSALAVLLSACTQADIVQYNLRRKAEDFNVRRRITVLNTRTDKAMMQITGLLSIDTDADGDLNITIQKAPGEFDNVFSVEPDKYCAWGERRDCE